jgi:hypothetical protein
MFRPWMAHACALALSLPAAVCVQAFREPDRVAPEQPPANPRPLAPLIAKALSSPQASTLQLSRDEINAHLALTLPPQKTDSDLWALQRVGIRLEPAKCEVLTRQLWRGHRLHLGALYSVSLKGGKLRLSLISGHVGRLKLPARWMRWFETPFLKMLPALRREHVLLDRLDDLKLTADRATLYVRISAGPSSSPP